MDALGKTLNQRLEDFATKISKEHEEQLALFSDNDYWGKLKVCSNTYHKILTEIEDVIIGNEDFSIFNVDIDEYLSGRESEEEIAFAMKDLQILQNMARKIAEVQTLREKHGIIVEACIVLIRPIYETLTHGFSLLHGTKALSLAIQLSWTILYQRKYRNVS